MQQLIYWINDQFKISIDTNEIFSNSNQSDDSVIKIEPRVMQVLKMLIEADGKLVSRECLLEKVWDNYEGGEEGINQAISKLRKIFHDDAKNAKVIETISKRGYRIITNIEKEYDKGLVRVKLNVDRNENIPSIIILLEYLKKPKHLAVFTLVSFVTCLFLYQLYKIIYAIVWS